MPAKTGRHPVALTAKVQSMELDLERNGSYRLLLEDGSTLRADFTGAQWDYLEGMHQRGRYPIKFVGAGEYADGRLKRIVSIDLKQTERVWPPEDLDPPPMWEWVSKISKSVDWTDVPADGAKNLHHYLYGRPKLDD